MPRPHRLWVRLVPVLVSLPVSMAVLSSLPLPQLGCYTLGYPHLKHNQTLLAQCSHAAMAAIGRAYASVYFYYFTTGKFFTAN